LSPFTQHDSYAVFDAATVDGLAASCFDGGAFDGRFAYFIPLSGGVPVRVDTTRPFDDATSWTAFDGKVAGMEMCVGGVFDGRWLYYVPYGHSNVVRFDTTGDFRDAKAWDSFDANGINGLRCGGFDGGFFDGRFVHFVPFINYLDQGGFKLHADFLRYDTAGAFDDNASWDAADASTTDGLKTVGFNAGAYDGRFFYCAPWRSECGQEPGQAGVNGRVLRCDTLGDGGSFNLAACGYGHNGGLCASAPGAMFTVNTTAGVVSCALNRSLSVGRHHLVGTYDGDSIKLYVDGKLAAESETPGAPIINGDAPVTVGELPGGTSVLRGSVHSGLIEDCCRDANWVGKRNP
jgi:hypothetical protein